MYHIIRSLNDKIYCALKFNLILAICLLAILLNLSSLNHYSFSDQAGKELSRSQENELIPGLMEALSDPNPVVRAKAINGLAKLNYNPALPHIIKFIESTNNELKNSRLVVTCSDIKYLEEHEDLKQLFDHIIFTPIILSEFM